MQRNLIVLRGLVLLALAISLVPAVHAGDTVCLVRDGQPQATIVIAEQPTRAAQLGAYELQHHVRLITGATLPIVQEPATVMGTRVLVGQSRAAHRMGVTPYGLTEQEFVIQYLPDTLVLLGVDEADYGEVVYDMENLAASKGFPGDYVERGTLDAVYEFLQRDCGVRWFNPTELGTVYPSRATLEVGGQDLKRKPAMRNRDAVWTGAGSYDRYIALWRPEDEEFKAWAAVSYPSIQKQYTNATEYNRARIALERLFLLRMRNGGAYVSCNHSLYGYYNRFLEGTWTDRLASAKDDQERERILAQKAMLYEGNHPEYFAQGYEAQPPQMCYTNPGLIQQVVKDAREYFDGTLAAHKLPYAHLKLPAPFPVEPMDNASFCKCDDCRALYEKDVAAAQESGDTDGMHSNYFFTFVNEVARELRKTHPDKQIITLAYGSHQLLPNFTLEPNVIVDFCYTTNRSPAAVEAYNAELETLKEWSQEGRPLYMWLYDTFPVEFARNGKYHCFPGFFAHTAFNQIRDYYELGVEGIFHCGYGQEVEAYVSFKAMDDPYQDVDQLLEEYFTGLYGPAGKPMRAMYEAMEDTWCDPALRPGTRVSGPELAWGHLGTAERMAHFQSLLDEAKALAETDLQKQRIAAFEHGTWSYMTRGRQNYVDRMKAPIPTVTVPRVAPAGGDAAKVNWDQAAGLPGPWYERGGATPTKRVYTARVAHDGEYLYLEMTDEVDTSKLHVSPLVACYDDWEVFVARQRALPYRQYMSGPTGMLAALSHGEVNFRMNVGMEDTGVKVVSDTSSGTKWVTRMIMPLARVLPGGVKPGESLFMNIIRVMNPTLAGQGPYGIDTWISYCTVHEADRLGELKLSE